MAPSCHRWQSAHRAPLSPTLLQPLLQPLLLLLLQFITPCLAQTPGGEEDHCRPDASTPSTPPRTCLMLPNGTQASCHGTCGQSSRRSVCRCDPACILYKDCCQDLDLTCPSIFSQREHMVVKHAQLRLDCLQFLFLRVEDGQRKGYRETVSLIASCRNGDHCVTTWSSDINHPNLAIPITDQLTGLSYVNFYCAKCNGVHAVKWWTPRLECDEAENGISSSAVIMDKSSLRIKLEQCSLHYLEPSGDGSDVTRFGCRLESSIAVEDVRSTCPTTCLNPMLVRKCEQSVTMDYFQDGQQIFLNYYCAMCFGNVSLADMTCLKRTTPVEIGSVKTRSLAVLLEFDPLKGLRVGTLQCPKGQHKPNNGGRVCKEDICPPDFTQSGDECIQISHRVLITTSLLFADSNDLVTSFLRFKATDTVKKMLMKIIACTLITDDAPYHKPPSPDIDASIISERIMNISIEFFFKNSTDAGKLFEVLEDRLKAPLADGALKWLTSFDISSSKVSVDTDVALIAAENIPSDCVWKRMSSKDFQFSNDSVTLLKSQQVFKKARFRVVGDKVFICTVTLPKEASGNEFEYRSVIAGTIAVAICLGLFYLGLRVVFCYKNSLHEKLHPMY